ncbi:hypothetical protein Pan153_33970 [Gimesia panareensis]|uniref:Uncharacterized protein n=1 Tax=Gimesia panareensis TaxID=2527978 RepID=A0A518FQV7_9PLAN|nr:hypothetical protein [Gimesia panareensis]QDV18736.1 hypothetical protein Pan153_33970 [Gimesia panareensis]
MNQSDLIFDELVTSFRELYNQQGQYHISSVLIECVDDRILNRGFIHYKDLPEKWGDTQGLTDDQTVYDRRDASRRIYCSKIVPVQNGNPSLPGRSGDNVLPEQLQIVRTRMVNCLEMAGRVLQESSLNEWLSQEISGCRNPGVAWIFFLHYIEKPDRRTWDRVNTVAVMGRELGVLEGDIGEIEPKDTNYLTTVGKFSFDPLQSNSFSVIRDIATSSIEAIRKMQQGLIEELKQDRIETVILEIGNRTDLTWAERANRFRGEFHNLGKYETESAFRGKYEKLCEKRGVPRAQSKSGRPKGK